MSRVQELLQEEIAFLRKRLEEQKEHIKKTKDRYAKGEITVDRCCEINESALGQKWRIERNLRELGINPT